MIWLIGSGPMAEAYISVLKELRKDFIIIGRGEESAKALEVKHQVDVVRGGLTSFLKSNPQKCDQAIIAVGVEQLYACAKELLEYGVKEILTEKPGTMTLEEIQSLSALAKVKDAKVFIAYNRRFYSSVLTAKKMIDADGGVLSFHYEFTEWAHVIEKVKKPKEVLENWLIANSSHVIDLAHHLGGWPSEIKTFSIGKNQLLWHPSNSIFSGAGQTKNGALFSYSSNWIAPGRWSLEVLTSKHRYIFRPMEELQIQKIGSVKVEGVAIDNALDVNFKPGIYRQTFSFLNNQYDGFCTLEDQVAHFEMYLKVRG